MSETVKMLPAPIRSAVPNDAESIARIYNHYIANTIVSFETEEVSPAEMANRIADVQTASLPWLVAEVDDRIVGYAYASPFHKRAAYRFTIELSVYLDPDFFGRGLGSRFYQLLIDDLTAKGVHSVIGGIAMPNQASVALHEKFGFEQAAYYREAGFKFDQWIDVTYWQKMLSRVGKNEL